MTPAAHARAEFQALFTARLDDTRLVAVLREGGKDLLGRLDQLETELAAVRMAGSRLYFALDAIVDTLDSGNDPSHQARQDGEVALDGWNSDEMLGTVSTGQEP